eukprot:1448317-Rhodomonas_salina.1
MKLVELCIAHPHHALLVVNSKPEVDVVVSPLSVAMHGVESQEKADDDQSDHCRIKMSTFYVTTSAPAGLGLRDLAFVLVRIDCRQARF